MGEKKKKEEKEEKKIKRRTKGEVNKTKGEEGGKKIE